MPLKTGYSWDVFQRNINEMVASGHDRNEAVVAAANKARASYFNRYPQGAIPAWLAHPKNYRLRRYYDKHGRSLRSDPERNSSNITGKILAKKEKIEHDIKRAKQLGFDFSGHNPKRLNKISIPNTPNVGLAIGQVLGIIYQTKRDGVLEKYIHRFTSKQSRPLLVTSPDGKQLLLVGGSYNFTDRGIVNVP